MRGVGENTGGAAYINWSRGLTQALQISDVQKEQLEDTHAAAFTAQAVTQQGITVTAEQSITDSYCAYIAFKIEGYHLPEGKEPGFNEMNISVTGIDEPNWNGSFYDGLSTDAKGNPVYADGTAVDPGAENIERFVQADGSLEYIVTLWAAEKGDFLNKDIHIELKDLGTVYQAAFHGDIDAEWDFGWNLQGTEKQKAGTLEQALGDTGATVIEYEMTPVSLHAECTFPRTTEEISVVDDDGNTVESETLADAPILAGVKMKDGTLIPFLCDGGSQGYASENSDNYVQTYSNDRILDVDQVSALLFHKEQADPSQEQDVPDESGYYVVPVD